MRRNHRTGSDVGRGGPPRNREARPGVEGLEGRLLLYAATGGAWPHPNAITFSFVPDGTNIAGAASNLNQTFNAKWSAAAWKSVFVEAAAIWEQVANVNLILVPDNGTPMGGGAYQQGDPNMGDIRISGLPSSVLGSGTLAYTLLPPQINGGSEAGDIIFNTSQPWQINSNYDLLTVAIHEFGHALGLGESQVQQSVMYGTYNGIEQALAPDDIAGIDSIYGPRQPDFFMSTNNNTTSANAANLNPYFNSSGQFGYGALDIQNPSQTEWFKVTVPSVSSGTMAITMQATNLSEMSPAFTLYNSALQPLGSAGTSNAFGGTTNLKAVGVEPGQVYYIQTYGLGYSQLSDGNYGLQVNFSQASLGPFPTPSTPTAATAGTGGGGQFDKTDYRGSPPNPHWLHQLELIENGHRDPRGGGVDGGGGGDGTSTAVGTFDTARAADPLATIASTTTILLVAPPQSSDSDTSLPSATPAGPLHAAKSSAWFGMSTS